MVTCSEETMSESDPGDYSGHVNWCGRVNYIAPKAIYYWGYINDKKPKSHGICSAYINLSEGEFCTNFLLQVSLESDMVIYT